MATRHQPVKKKRKLPVNRCHPTTSPLRHRLAPRNPPPLNNWPPAIEEEEETPPANSRPTTSSSPSPPRPKQTLCRWIIRLSNSTRIRVGNVDMNKSRSTHIQTTHIQTKTSTWLRASTNFSVYSVYQMVLCLNLEQTWSNLRSKTSNGKNPKILNLKKWFPLKANKWNESKWHLI